MCYDKGVKKTGREVTVLRIRRYSRQQELIYQYLCATKEHPTAEMVFQQLRPQLPSLSLGTVYRNLNRFCEEGKAIKLHLPVERYDADTTPHAHFSCQCCGRVIDLPELQEERLTQVSQRFGHQATSCELVYFGICADCLKQQA
jgi:Fur family peroxide stress response transcriptional regulator